MLMYVHVHVLLPVWCMNLCCVFVPSNFVDKCTHRTILKKKKNLNFFFFQNQSEAYHLVPLWLFWFSFDTAQPKTKCPGSQVMPIVDTIHFTS